MKQEIIFIKLGGSLITDKRKRETPRPHRIENIARTIRDFLQNSPHTHLLIGHGSGSYGHWEATKYDTRTGVATSHQWQGFTRVSAAASRLNRLVVDIFLEVGVPVFSLQPSASIDADSGVIQHFNTRNIMKCFEHHLVPLIYGDVVFDKSLGGTILSTEDLFAYLTPIFQPNRIILLGNAPGVYSHQGQIISKITPTSYHRIETYLHGSKYTDVTGGMADKVKCMVDLVISNPSLEVRIVSGKNSETVFQILANDAYTTGTTISKT
jgi:isopentenyl phosphate kinase